jgi:hypothetical protein
MLSALRAPLARVARENDVRRGEPARLGRRLGAGEEAATGGGFHPARLARLRGRAQVPASLAQAVEWIPRKLGGIIRRMAEVRQGLGALGLEESPATSTMRAEYEEELPAAA